MFSISNELFLLLKLTDRTVNFDKVFIEKQLNSEINWEHFIKIAQSHKLLLPAMNKLINFTDSIPENIVSKLTKLRHQLLKRQILIDYEANFIINKLTEVGNRAILFKGSNLAKDIYGNINERMTGDIDIFCDFRDFSNIKKILEDNNYKLKTPYNTFSKKRLDYTIKHNKDISFINHEKRTIIELHWKINNFDFIGKENRIFEFDNLKNIVSNQLTPNFVLYLIIHGAVHNWMRLFWLRDIYHILFNHPDLFKQVVELAQKHKSEFFIRLVSNLIEKVYGVKFPNFNFIPSKNDEWMIQYCLESLEKYNEELLLKDVFKRALYLSKLRDNLAYKIKVFRNLFIKSEDLELIPINDKFIYLSYPLAPFFRLFRYIELRREWKINQVQSF